MARIKNRFGNDSDHFYVRNRKDKQISNYKESNVKVKHALTL